MDDWCKISQVYDPLKAGSIDGTDEYPHDKAISRAMQVKYKPNKSVTGDPSNTVFAGRLNPHTDEASLGTCFSEYGEIKRLRLVRDIVTGTSKCYAFIEYNNNDDAYRAQRNLDKTILDDMEIYVDFECERTMKGWVPRRLGGGICGKKESGQLRFGGKNRPFRKPINMDTGMVPEGRTFRDRLRVMEGDGHAGRDRDIDRRRCNDSERRDGGSYGNRQRGSERDRSPRRRERRSRDREYDSKQSRGRRSRSRERRSRSRERSRSSDRKRSRNSSRRDR